MKKLFIAVTVCLCCLGSSLAHAVTVAAGNPLTLEFSNLPFVGNVNSCCSSGASIFLAGDLLDVGDNIRLEFFENSPAEPSIHWDFNEGTWTVPSDSFGAGIAVHAGDPTPWSNDLQGAIRLTSLSGSVNVDHITITVFPEKVQPGPKYSQTFDFPSSVTPLPATLPLLASALGGLGFLGWLRKRASTA